MYDPEKYPSFIRVKKEDVTLKFVFDNIRNIGLSALAFSLGVAVIKGDPISILFSIQYTEIVIGALMCLGAFLISLLNYFQGVLAIVAVERFNVVLYMVMAFLLHIATYEIFLKLVLKNVGQ